MNKKLTIAIDGYSSCGKSTVAKAIAKALQYVYVDSGAMYRSVCLFLMNKGIIKDNRFLERQVISALPAIKIRFETDSEGNSMTFLNDENVENEIRTLAVSQMVSQISTVKSVREMLVALQQEMGKNGGVVMDGRDIGTVVFPFAELKIFMTADVDIRTERRLNELNNKNQKSNFDEVKANLQHRDYVDMNREISPLIKAEDAIIIDNSFLTHEEQLARVMQMVNERL